LRSEIAQANFGDLIEKLDRPEDFKSMLKVLLKFPDELSPSFTLDACFENPLVIQAMLDIMGDMKNSRALIEYKRVSENISRLFMIKYYGEEILQHYKWSPYF
jgi:hypothetical protein